MEIFRQAAREREKWAFKSRDYFAFPKRSKIYQVYFKVSEERWRLFVCSLYTIQRFLPLKELQ